MKARNNTKDTSKSTRKRPVYHEDDYKREYAHEESPSNERALHSPQRLAEPIQGGLDTFSKIITFVLSLVTPLLLLGISGILAGFFWRGSRLYGDATLALRTGEPTDVLLGYFAVAGFLLFYLLFSLLWSITRATGWDQYGKYKYDSGRGLFSFIIILACSYSAFLFGNRIPYPTEFIRGLRGALLVFGSSHIAIFGLCVAGIIVCVIRKCRN